MSDRTSLDALSRTIEGLEARIEGLMGSTAAKDPRQSPLPAYAPAPERMPLPQRPAPASRETYGRQPYERPAAPERMERDARPDPLSEIRQRQRMLEASRERGYARQEEAAPAPRQSFAARAPDMQAPRHEPAQRTSPDAMTEVAQALVSLRHDLKQDIAEGVAREMNALKTEIRNIKTNAEDRNFTDDVREDMARLADSINSLAGGHAGLPDTDGLKTEFDELRSLMDGLAREESVRGMETRWDGLEDRLHALDTSGLQEELVSLAYRLDDLKRQIGGMSESPAVHALEQKMISIATAMEQFGSMMQPHDRSMSEQFSTIDSRLDEISRAIAASGRTAASAADPALMQRLENRITGLAEQIDLMSREATHRQQPADDLAGRIEALTMRIEELSNVEATSKLEERLDQLSYLMERSQKAAPQPELTDYLADISRKIDALDHGSVNGVLAERLDYLARRIDEMDVHQPFPAAAVDDSAMRRLEDRLIDIAARLDESTVAAPTDAHALRGLEEQIAHLSSLMSEPRGGSDVFAADFDRRMGALEDYMSTNDEYIIEAARQAAEAVVEAYSRNGAFSGGAPAAADMSALTALAEDLRHLEDISRSSDDRTHRTFEALHDTLVQIADRLDHMESPRQAARMPAADFDVDPFAYAEEPAAETRSVATTPRAAPVIRTASIAEPTAAETFNAPLDTAAKAEIKAAAQKDGVKSSLFASLGKRFRPTRKGEQAATGDRPLIDPAPSIDPVDVMPQEENDEPLEPGSGAPDVKKILERVRASQNAARGGNAAAASDGDRADYIAAARRAAQAAALEADQTQRNSNASRDGGKKGGKAFSRFRRPILLAVGAALLAIMAFPLVNTLTRGEKAPDPAQISALSTTPANPPADQRPAIGQPTDASEQAAGNAAAAPEALGASGETDGDVQPPLAPPSAAAPAAGDSHLTDAAPLDSNAANETMTPATPSQDATAFAPSKDSSATTAPAAPQTATAIAPAAPAQPAIAVPDTIQPPALADAAKSGDPLALFEIGARFTDGRGVGADLKQAAAWYQLAADKGFAPAEYRLASMYEKGNGIDRDLAKAKTYYERAAGQGNASAMHNLAVLYASGSAGPQDYTAAADWFTKAANLGVSDSQFNLAILYARGNGVKQDLGESYKWFAVAAKAGDKDAAQKRDQVANSMKPDQLNDARTKADLWKPQPLDSKANNIDLPDEWSGKGVHTASIDMKKAIRNIQAILNNNGFDAGPPDGEMGGKTVTALKNFQKSVGLPVDGKVTDQLVKQLLARNK